YSCSYLLLFLMLRRYPLVTLFPYTTLFRSYEAFSARLSSNGVNVALRGKNISYAFLDANQKQRRARGVRLGTDYDKEALLDELRSEEHTSELQSRFDLVCRLLLEKKNQTKN